MKPWVGLGGGLLLSGAACAVPSPPAVPDGDRLFGQHCYGCHALEPGRNTPAGPTLNAIVDRRVAAEPGFNYSPAMRRLAARQPRWTAAALDQFLADPEAAVPGTEMGLPGIADAAERRAIINWLADRDAERESTTSR